LNGWERNRFKYPEQYKGFIIPYYRVLYALGIRHVGETVAKTLASRFMSLDELMAADEGMLTGVREIGPKIVQHHLVFQRSGEH
jgi:DNA ligase (NAD+)